MHYHFYSARQIEKRGYSIRTLIMAAISRADNANRNTLKTAYPDTFKEWNDRVASPDGFITEKERVYYGDPGEPE